MRVSFHRIDFGLRIIVAAGPAILLVTTAFHLAELTGAIAFGVCAVLLAAIVFRSGATICVTRAGIRVGFSPFWFAAFPYGSIRRVALEDVRPLEDFGGWGIKGRAQRKGLLFSAGGTSAVAFTLLDGRRYLVSVHPDEGASVVERLNAEISVVRASQGSP